ncbi:hypothetical protein DAPPUDRAFT_266557 [Daphnia pulex]|uniref:C2H2-type domain-containing protein n=1 Tax=Daphnia pulex TaxID=6669 RepID=E9HV70_DAPPU|nr:hypothetical protein DAPPUDRAFT_266557 [Daphnia pulex]|eukprot:EFX64360.1 hypothetical protein DAPPUDRAFT_266557 [Daphnia pulex]
MSDSDAAPADDPSSGGRFTENVEEVVYISLPIPPSTTFSCHICSTVGQRLASHNSLKKHFRTTHKSSVIVKFECAICRFELPGVKSYAAHQAEFHPNQRVLSPTPLEPAVPLLPISSADIDDFLLAARQQASSDRQTPEPTPEATSPLGVATSVSVSSSSGSVHYSHRPPGLLINFGPSATPPLISAGPSRLPSPDPPDDHSSLWSWTGLTNVLYDECAYPVIGGCWERGGGGRRHPLRPNVPSVSVPLVSAPSVPEDILHARQLLFPSVAPPLSPEVLHPCATDGSFFTESPNPTLCLRNTTPRDDPPAALHCEVGSFVGHSPDSSDDAYSSSSERVLSSLLSDIPP